MSISATCATDWISRLILPVCIHRRDDTRAQVLRDLTPLVLDWAMARDTLISPRKWRAGAVLIAVALAARLAFLPFATLDDGDTAYRIWFAWLWSDDPFLITNGLWGPLHLYLIGATMWLWPDPVWAPIVLHIAIGAVTPLVMYRWTLELFRSDRAAMAAGLIMAVYPAAIGVSLGPLSEAPFMLSLGLALLYLTRACRPEGSIQDAALAGLAMTLASMLRYEAWVLLPFLAVLLLRHPRRAAAFTSIALIHPVFWMIGNEIAYGDALRGLTATAKWRLEVLGHEPNLGFAPSARRLWRFVRMTALGLTLPVSLLIAAGVIRVLVHRRAESAWLIPPLGLFLTFVWAAVQDTLFIKPAFTTTFGFLLIPFAAVSLEVIAVHSWSRARSTLAGAVLVASILLFAAEPLMKSQPVGRRLGTHAAPHIDDEDSAGELLDVIRQAGLRHPDDALILDFVGNHVTPYIAWQTRLHPWQICRPRGEANVPLRTDELAAFLAGNRSGVLVTRPSSKLSAHLKLAADGKGILGGVPVRLVPVGSMEWQSESALRRFGTLTISRYEVVGDSGTSSSAATACSSSCPIMLCTETRRR